MTWRTGRHYGIHIYEDDRPVATFHDPADAQRAVDAVNTAHGPDHLVTIEPNRPDRALCTCGRWVTGPPELLHQWAQQHEQP
jgi:hypothetical protein